MERETSKYRFVQRWDDNTSIVWWNECRKELNKIIDVYNEWQIEHDFDAERSRFVLAKIEYGKQTIGARDGGGGYFDALDEMEKFVISASQKTIEDDLN